MLTRLFYSLIVIIQFILPAHVAAIEVQNVRSGLVCPDPDNTKFESQFESRICFETEKILITGQGDCIYDGEPQHCTWYGYEFDYTNATSEDLVSCVITSSEGQNIGNPHEVTVPDARHYEYSYSLNPGNGHYFHPEYAVFSYSDDLGFSIEEELACSANGTELFRIKREFVYPSQ